LLKKGLIKPKMYAHLKPALLRETAWHLSQIQVQEEEKRSAKKGNNYNRYDYYDGSYGGGAESTIERNFNLLAPFFKKDKAVQDLLERAIRYGDKETQLLAYGFYLQNDIPVAPEKLKPFSDDDQTRWSLFEKLAKMKKLPGYASWFSDTTALARSLVVQRGEGRNIDSIRFISKHKTVLDNKPADLYFFDVKREDDKEWGLASAIMPKDYSYLAKKDDKIGGYNEYTAPDYYDGEYGYGRGPAVQFMFDLSGKEKEEFVRKKIGEIRFANRERYVNYDSSGRYYYNDGY